MLQLLRSHTLNSVTLRDIRVKWTKRQSRQAMTEIGPAPVSERSVPEIEHLVPRIPAADCTMELQRKHSRLDVCHGSRAIAILL